MAKTFYADEISDHLTYAALAQHLNDEQGRRNIMRIAGMERRHADFWQEMLTAHQETLPQAGVNKARLGLMHLLRLFINPALIVSLLELGEAGAMKRYLDFYRHAPLEDADKARLKGIILDEVEHEMFFKQMAQTLGVSNLRDFVLGMNDGLVEILGAVTGLSAVYPTRPMLVAMTGLILGLAGSLSMGIGAFISVRSQRQVNEGTRERMEILFAIDPERAVHAYRGELIESGIPWHLAEETARVLGKNKQALVNLVLPTSNDENELRSGLFTGLAYFVGVLFPVLPYFLAPSSSIALPLSVVFAGVSLTLVATVVAMLSGIPMRQKIAEMVISGFTAAGLSYGFGMLMRSVFGIGAEM
jgi:VIT1/CCC1 family predicted Fe2+/Mn2+ transporter